MSLRTLAVLALALSVVTCRDALGPRGTGGGQGRVVFAPVLPSEGALASFGLAIDQVRIIVVRPAADTLADTTVALPPDSSGVDLDLHVSLLTSPETLSVSIIALAGSQPLFTGTGDVEVTSGSDTPTPADIPVDNYVGPGAGVDSIDIQPAAPFIYLNDSLRFQVQAFQAGVPVNLFYVSWSTSDSTVATVNGFGVLRAPATRTSVRVRALTPGGAGDSVTVTFVPLPTQLVNIAGGGQTAPAGQQLATQLEVEVRGSDNLPIGGVGVRFRALSGGSPNDTTVNPGVNGRAKVTGVLGATPGAQSFQATIPAYPAVPAVTFNATAVGTISAATSTISVSAASVASGGAVTLTLRGKDAAGTNLTVGGDTVAFNYSGGTSTGTIGPTTDNGNGTYSATFTAGSAGTATSIGATINGVAVTTTLPTVTVSSGVIASVTVTPGTPTLTALGQTQAFTAVARDGGNNVVATTFIWTTSAPGVATVNTSGVATAVANGPATIRATATGGVFGTATLTVAQAVATVQVQPSLDTLRAVNQGRVFTAVAKDANANVVPGETFTWLSSAPSVATINNSTGAATAVGNGTTTIRATAASNGATGTATLVVDQAVSTVAVTPPTASLTALGATQSFGAVARDSNNNVIAGATFVWTSSDTAVAKVNASGVATAFGNGSATISAATGGVSGTASLNVAQVATRLIFTAQPSTVASGTPIAPAVAVAGADSLGNVVASFVGSITIAIGTNPGGGVLSGTLTQTTTLGVATFADLQIDQSGSGYTLVATGTLPSATSTSFDVAPPATLVSWINAAGGNWSNPANWSGGFVPALGDTALINLAGTYTVTLDVNDTVGGLRIGGASGTQTLAAGSGRTLGVGGGAQVNTNGALTLSSATLNGIGALTNAGTVTVQSATVVKPLSNQATLRVNGNSTFSGPFTTASSSLIRIQGMGTFGAAILNVSNAFTNNGSIVLTDSASSFGATLNVTSGTLTNAPAGTIDAAVGAGGPRTLGVQLDNQGTLTVSRLLTLSRASAAHSSGGAINLAGGDFSIVQSGTLPSFTNTGAITMTAGDSVKVSSGSFNYDGGSISGGTLSLSFVTVTAPQSFTTATAGLSVASTTWGGSGVLTIAPATTVFWRTSAITAPLVNQGTLVVNGSSAFNGSVANAAAATLQLQGNGTYGSSALTVANSFTNSGAIVLTDVSSSYGATLTMPAGATLTNAAGATIEAAVGALGPRTLALELDNRGTVTLNRALTLSRASAAHANSGTIDVANGNLTILQSGTAPSFTNTGAIPIASGDSVKVTSGALNLSGGTISGGTLSLTSTAVTAAQDFSTATAALSLATSSWGGSGTLTIAPSTAVFWRASTITAALVNQGTITVNGSSAFNGAVTNASGATLEMQGNGTYGGANLTVATSFMNNGAIVLTDITSSYGATLTMPAGATLTNGPAATIDAAVGASGPRTLALELNNQGTVTVNRVLTLSRSGAAHQNSGTINVSGADLAITQSGTTPSFTTTGAISIGAGDSVKLSAGAFNYTSGTISGPGTLAVTSANVTAVPSFTTATTGLSLTSATWGGSGTLTVAASTSLPMRASTINSALVNQGTITANGANAVNGPLTNATGATLRIQGNGTYGLGTVTVANGFTNDGTIELTDVTSSYGATLIVTSGTLVNATGGTINAPLGSNGTRTLNAQVDNRGSINVATAANVALTLNKASAAHQNSGTIAVTGGDLSVSQTGTTPSFTNTGSITVAAGDTFRVTGGAFTHNAGTIGGPGAMALTSVPAGAFNVAHSIASLLITSSTVSFATAQSTGATGFVLTSSTINGPGLLTNDPGKLLIVRASTINADLNNQGTLWVTGLSNFNGAMTTSGTSALRVQGNGTYGAATMTVLNGFTNNGTIELTDTTSSYGAQLNVTNGVLVNAAGASVAAVLGANGTRTLGAALDNRGVLTVALGPGRLFTLAKSSAAHQNTGTIDVGGGDLTITQSGTGPTFTNLGAITVGGNDTLTISGGAFTYGGGSLDGPGTLVLSSVNPANFSKPHTLGSIIMVSSTASFAPDQSTATTAFSLSSSTLNGPGTLTNAPGRTLTVRSSGIAAPFVNQGIVIAAGSSSIDALTTASGSTLQVQGNGQYAGGTLTVNNGLINNGTIELTDVASSYGATLVVKTLPLVNIGTIDILPGANGPRTIDAVLDNRGTFTGNQPVTISHASAAHTNRGTFKVKAGAITFAQSGGNPSFTNQAGGLIDIDAGMVFRVTAGPVTNSLGGKIAGFGTLDVRPPATFAHDGEILPGASPGKLTVAGNLQITSTGIVTIELGGPAPGTQYDQLAITGTASIAEGTLNVVLLPTLPDPKGMSFDVVTFASGTGSFRNFTVPTGCNQPVNTGTSIRVICP